MVFKLDFEKSHTFKTVDKPKTGSKRVNPYKEVKKLSAAACEEGPKVGPLTKFFEEIQNYNLKCLILGKSLKNG